MEIYVVVHDTYTEQNVFFTDRATAEQYLEKVAADPDTMSTVDDWRIETLTEGQKFEAEELAEIGLPPTNGPC